MISAPSSSKAVNARRLIDTYQTLIISIVTALAGLGLLYLAGRDDWWKHAHGARALVDSLGALLIASVALGLIWEYAGKRGFARQILATASAGADLETLGIDRMSMNYIEVPDWAALFIGLQKLDVFVAYGRTWRRNNFQRLQQLAGTPGSRIRIFLADPDDELTMSSMAPRFNMTIEALKAAIMEARDEYAALPVGQGSTIEVFYRSGESLFSCYRLDGVAVLTMYTHSRQRMGVPTIQCRDGGQLYKFVRGEFKALESQSRQVYP